MDFGGKGSRRNQLKQFHMQSVFVYPAVRIAILAAILGANKSGRDLQGVSSWGALQDPQRYRVIIEVHRPIGRSGVYLF